jgi:para-nitrobenzyl esterase
MRDPRDPRSIRRLARVWSVIACVVATPGGVVVRASAQAAPSATADTADAPRVTVDAGTLVGRVDSTTGVRMFLGVPFAAPPVSARRWRPPEAVASWSGTRAATTFGPACPQRVFAGPGAATVATSEDCLTLNVWTAAAPGAAPRERRPVMVWLYGGAFMQGHPYRPEMDGRELARRGAVVVSFNYRVGPLGFLAHPALDAESPRGVSGNYGLLDQIAALQWVRRNIARFGGDSTRVTVFGVSAGAMSIGMLIASPLATGLFHRAIMESGTGAGFAIPLDAPPGQTFAATGDPYGTGLRRWPRYDLRRDEYLELGEHIAVRADARASRLDNLAHWDPAFRSTSTPRR